MHFQDFATNWFGLRHAQRNNQSWFCHTQSKETSTVNPLLCPRGTGLFISNTFGGGWGGGGGGGLIEIGGLFETGFFKFSLAKTVLSVLLEELEYKVEKLKYKKLEITQPRIRNKSELLVGKYSLVKNNKGEGRGRRGGERERLLTFFPERRVLIRERGLIWEWAWGFTVSLMQQAKSYLRYMSLGKISNCIWIRLPNDLKSSAVYALIWLHNF